MIQPHRHRIILIEIDRAEQRWIARKLEEEEKYQPKKKKWRSRVGLEFGMGEIVRIAFFG